MDSDSDEVIQLLEAKGMPESGVIKLIQSNPSQIRTASHGPRESLQ